MTDDEFTDRVRSMVEQENSMRDQRLNWLIASQGLLMTALGFSWDKDRFLVISLSIAGLLFCVSIGSNLYCNTLAIRKLAGIWKERCKATYQGPGVTALRSENIHPRIITWLYPWDVLPLSLSVFWIAVLCYKALP
jgi:hypothetical protein